jgi:hypothetical protein
MRPPIATIDRPPAKPFDPVAFVTLKCLHLCPHSRDEHFGPVGVHPTGELVGAHAPHHKKRWGRKRQRALGEKTAPR